jgi:hypothetical protein
VRANRNPLLRPVTFASTIAANKLGILS